MVALTDFDVFRRPPADLHERGTTGGSVLSLVSAALLVLIVGWHVMTFVAFPAKSTEMVVRQFRKDRVKISLLLDIAMPCPLVDLEVHDALGTHTLDSSRSISKNRMNSDGQRLPAGSEIVSDTGISVALKHDQQHHRPESGKGVHEDYLKTDGHSQLDAMGDEAAVAVKAMVKANEWCRFNGTVTVAKMPGKLFLHSHHALLAEAIGDELQSDDWYNSTHYIHQMQFFDIHATEPHPAFASIVAKFESKFTGLGSMLGFPALPGMTPMDLTRRLMTQTRTNWKYDTQVVQQVSASGEESYTFTMGHYSYEMGPGPFKDETCQPFAMSYEFSPITVVRKETYQSFMQFLCSLLATLGGCFAVLRLVDNTIFVGRHIVVKSRMGKIV